MKRRKYYITGLIACILLCVVSLFLPLSLGETRALLFGLGVIFAFVFIICLIVNAIRCRRVHRREEAQAAQQVNDTVTVKPVPAEEKCTDTAVPANTISDHSKKDVANRYLFYDVETPNRRNDSICAVGLVLYEDNVKVSQEYQFIDPIAPFDAINTRIHGLNAVIVSGAPTFAEYWTKKLGKLMTTSVVIAHGANFDISVTAKALATEGIDLPDIQYYDSVPAFRALYPDKRCKLSDLASHFGFDYHEHHAGEDAAALADVISAACQEKGFASFTEFFEASKVQAQSGLNKQSNDEPDRPTFDHTEYEASLQRIIANAQVKNVDLSEIHFAFHGVSADPIIFRKNGLDRIVEALGGVFHDNVSGKLDYYVCFDDDEPNTVLKARSIAQDPRYHLHIIDSQAFFHIIGYGCDEPDHAGPAEIRSRKQREKEEKEAAIREKETARAQKEARKIERELQKAEREPRQPKGRAVRQLDMDGNLINEYPSIAIAASTVGTNAKSIREVLAGKQKKAGGYRWEAVSADDISD